MAGYPPNPGSGYPYGGAGGYGAPPPPYGSSPAPSAPPYGEKPPKEALRQRRRLRPQSYGGGYGAPPSSQPYGAPYGAPPPSSAPYGAPGGYGSPFASLVPSAFPPGTDPNVVACFQAADRDGSGMIDDKELQSALSGYSQSFSLRTVHLLMYLFTNTNVRKIGFNRIVENPSSSCVVIMVWSTLIAFLVIVQAISLSNHLLPLFYNMFLAHFEAITKRIICCLTVKGLTEKFKEKDTAFSGSATFTYEAFMLTVLPFLIA
uniref:EF-hand domain-containing protein n=1 Tax=Oryza rufipogon TaxID=4529 RepID=A0A0E0R401_ORYRU